MISSNENTFCVVFCLWMSIQAHKQNCYLPAGINTLFLSVFWLNNAVDSTINNHKLDRMDTWNMSVACSPVMRRSNKEIQIRITFATAAMTKYSNISEKLNNRFPTKTRLYRAPVVTILLCGCEGLTLTAAVMKKFEMF